jgi:hypothetical protein
LSNQATNQRYNFSNWTEEALANLKWQVDCAIFERESQRMELWKKRFKVGDRVLINFVDGTKAYGEILSIAVKSVVVKMDSGEKKRMPPKHLWPLEVPRPAENVIPFNQIRSSRKFAGSGKNW